MDCLLAWTSEKLVAHSEAGTLYTLSYEETKAQIKQEFSKLFPDSGIEISEDETGEFLEVHLVTHQGVKDFDYMQELAQEWESKNPDEDY